MEIRVLGISGSPVKNGNVEHFLDYIMKKASARKDVLVDTIHLSEVELGDCTHCNFCIRKQTADKYCALNDDGQKIFGMAEAADVIVLAAPVYFMRTSGRMAALIDRLRVFVFGNVAGGKLKNKVGVSAAVAWARHGGLETTHLSHIEAFLTLEMIPVSVHHCVSPLGASAVSSQGGMGIFDKSMRLGAMNDVSGLHTAEAMVNRSLELSALLKKGAAAG